MEFLTGEEDPGDRGLIFAINTYGRWSGGFQNVFTIAIFGDDPEPEFFVIGVDFGLATEGDFNGQMVSLIVDPDGNVLDAWVADAPANGSTVLLPALASDIDRTDPDSTVDYEVLGENQFDSSNPAEGFEDEVEGRASLSVFDPAVSNGDFLLINRGARQARARGQRGCPGGPSVQGLDDRHARRHERGHAGGPAAGGRPALRHQPNAHNEAPGIAGGFTFPTGPRPGRAPAVVRSRRAAG